ncbi:unnamed protein product [Linum trigynum]|uniref:Uncharacterized protein n=1 Tax=Linum trigynum TaxID=586398 RepID=A0AAV2FU33_9ROSI
MSRPAKARPGIRKESQPRHSYLLGRDRTSWGQRNDNAVAARGGVGVRRCETETEVGSCLCLSLIPVVTAGLDHGRWREMAENFFLHLLTPVICGWVLHDGGGMEFAEPWILLHKF